MKSFNDLDTNSKDAISIRARAEAAHTEIGLLCEGGKGWRMTIPPQMTDSDIVLSAPLHDVEYLLAENARQLARIAKLEREIAEKDHLVEAARFIVEQE